MRRVKVRLISLGCAKNRVDSEYMLGNLAAHGIEIVPEGSKSDAVLINTCSFLESACEEAIDTILEAASDKKAGRTGKVLVAGCLPNRYGTDLAKELPEVDGVITPGQYKDVAQFVLNALGGSKPQLIGGKGYLGEGASRILTNAGHYAYLKISDGCDNRCSYCMIPEIRGNHASKPMEGVLNEARSLVEKGVKELVLIAQDTTRYGTDIYGAPRLHELVRRLSDIDGLMWLRLMYAYPDRTDGLIAGLFEEAGASKLVSYIDLPSQHGSGRILKAMNRTGGPEAILRAAERLRRARSKMAIRTTFMVGFPGETEEDFAELMEFIRQLKPARAGVFKFSAEDGTLAAEMPDQVPDEVKTHREKEAMLLLAEMSREFNSERVGEKADILIDGPSQESELLMEGRSYAEAPEEDGHILIGDATLKPGDLIRARITDYGDYDLAAEPII